MKEHTTSTAIPTHALKTEALASSKRDVTATYRAAY